MTRERKQSGEKNAVQTNDPNQGVAPQMNDKQPSNPLHGITLEALLVQLAADYGWPELGSPHRHRLFQL
jgi:hypothetical protein